MPPVNTVKSWFYISAFVLCLVKLSVITWHEKSQCANDVCTHLSVAT